MSSPEKPQEAETPVGVLDELVEQLEEDSPELSPGPTASVVMDPIPTSKSSITLEQAAERLGPKVLEALEEKFNGSLTEVRTTDERDLLF